MNATCQSTIVPSLNQNNWYRNVALCMLLISLRAIGDSSDAAGNVTFDVNDVSFLWPVPKNQGDVDALISADDKLADGTSPIWPKDAFDLVIGEAQKVKVNGSQIAFPSSDFTNPHTWKVVGIRVNPSAFGITTNLLQKFPEVPGIRLIMQPVTVGSGGKPEVHDFTAHVVFSYVKPGSTPTSPLPDKDAFGGIVQSLEEIKAIVEAKAPTKGNLSIHPGFTLDVPKFREALRSFLGKHLNSARLNAVSFMGIPKKNEPWIFFGVAKSPTDGKFGIRDINGNFKSQNPKSQMLSFVGGPIVVPAQTLDAAKGINTASTALLFDGTNGVVTARLNTPLFPGSMQPELAKLELRHIPDLIANPELNNVRTTDCVSCHTESIRRTDLSIVSNPTIAFQRPAGISGVDPAVLPKNNWDVRAFGWFPDVRSAGIPTTATVSQRAANEAAESADFINRNYLK